MRWRGSLPRSYSSQKATRRPCSAQTPCPSGRTRSPVISRTQVRSDHHTASWVPGVVQACVRGGFTEEVVDAEGVPEPRAGGKPVDPVTDRGGAWRGLAVAGGQVRRAERADRPPPGL